jgi:hypothetical protein
MLSAFAPAALVCLNVEVAMAAPETPLDTIYTADEAAERLRLTNRAVIKIARQYGLCSRQGRSYLFSESDLLALWEVMREPGKEPKRPAVKVQPVKDWMKDHSWLFGPSVSVDRREIEILRLLGQKKTPCTHKQVNRAGPRTIESFLRQGFVIEKGRDDEGDAKVSITDRGREQIAIVDKWIQLRIKNGKSPGSWARHMNHI